MKELKDRSGNPLQEAYYNHDNRNYIHHISQKGKSWTAQFNRNMIMLTPQISRYLSICDNQEEAERIFKEQLELGKNKLEKLSEGIPG